MPRVQFVVEMVGTDPIPAGTAALLLQPTWRQPLGEPNVFVLRPGEPSWVRLIPTNQGVYDSIALSWNFVARDGTLSDVTAAQLVSVAEKFCSFIRRRAVPLTPVQNAGRVAAALRELADTLDVGFSLVLIPKGDGITERDVWISCAALGLNFSTEGSFDWCVSGHPFPVLSVTPIGAVERFSLSSVRRDVKHDGLTVGFRLVTCPAPDVAAQGAYRTIDYLAGSLDGIAFDDAQRPLTEEVRVSIRRSLATAISLLTQSGIAPGSPEAISLFNT